MRRAHGHQICRAGGAAAIPRAGCIARDPSGKRASGNGGDAVFEISRQRARSENRAGANLRTRQAIVIDGDEEEYFVLQDRAADFAAELVHALTLAGQARQIAEIVVGVEEVIAVIPPAAAVVFIAATLGFEANLHSAFAGLLGALPGGGDAEFLDRVHARTDVGEEAVIRLQDVVLHVDAVVGDVDRALGQTEERSLPRAPGGRSAGHQGGQVQRIARGEGQLRDGAPGDRGADGSGSGFHHFRAGFHHYGGLDGADFEFRLQVVGSTHDNFYAAKLGGFEAFQGHGDDVQTGSQAGGSKCTIRAGLGFNHRSCGLVFYEDSRAGDHRTGRVRDCAQQRARGAYLGGCNAGAQQEIDCRKNQQFLDDCH